MDFGTVRAPPSPHASSRGPLARLLDCRPRLPTEDLEDLDVMDTAEVGRSFLKPRPWELLGRELDRDGGPGVRFMTLHV